MIIRMNLEGTMLSEINQKKKEKHYMILISLIWGIQTVKLIEAESRMVVARDWGKGDKRGVISQNFSYARWVSTRNLLYNTVPIVNNMVSCTPKFDMRIYIMLNVLTTHTEMQNLKQNRKTQGNFGRCWICVLPGFWSWFPRCFSMSKLFNLCMWNTCHSLHIKYTWATLLGKNKQTKKN